MHPERFELSPPERLRLECSALDHSATDANGNKKSTPAGTRTGGSNPEHKKSSDFHGKFDGNLVCWKGGNGIFPSPYTTSVKIHNAGRILAIV